MLTHAGVALPADRSIDGVDLTPVLLGGKSLHECLFNYKTGAAGVAVARCGRYKLHFDGPDGGGLAPGGPLFDVVADPHEDSPLDLTDPANAAIATKIVAARAAHDATVVRVEDQILLGSDDRWALCAAPDSKARYPRLPNCTLDPQNWINPWLAAAR